MHGATMQQICSYWTELRGPRFRMNNYDRYRGAWFYVDDSALPSKSTFSFLTQLLALQSGEVKSSAPVLTIPIGG